MKKWEKYTKPIKEGSCSIWRSIHKSGYVMTKDKNGKWILEHILVIENYIGRKLNKGEIVHHADHNRSNNNIENLFLCKNPLDHGFVDCGLDFVKQNNIPYVITNERRFEVIRNES